MKRRPNYGKKVSCEWGGNHFVKKFPLAFKVLLDESYNEGTPFGLWFKEINNEGQSETYVIQEELEHNLDNFIDEYGDGLKYLIGFTGIGKTTLLKNHFRTLKRDIEINKNSIIIYISFFTADLNTTNIDQSVEEEIANYIKRTIDLLWRIPGVDNPYEKDSKFNNRFYDFIENMKPVLLYTNDFSPAMMSIDRTTDEYIKKALNSLLNKNKIEYHSCMLKYALSFCRNIKKVIFVYDDIEALKEIRFHKAIISKANHIHSCLITSRDRYYFTKTIISLRAFTFRSNVDSDFEARRQIVDRDVILKDSVPDIAEIFIKRFIVAMKQNYENENIGNIETWNDAIEVLKKIVQGLSINFGTLISALTNYNIPRSFMMFGKIITNHRWFGLHEAEYENDGKFIINLKSYVNTAEAVFRALAYGEENVYIDGSDNIFTNILYCHDDEFKGCELLCLYIIKYFSVARQENDEFLYGRKYEVCSEVVNNIMSIYEKSEKTFRHNLEQKLNHILKFLYQSRVLLRSIKDYEDAHEAIAQSERVYKDNFGVYLSLRGDRLFKMLSENTLLFELYRDDIDTDIEGNNRITIDMSQTERFIYMIKYVEKLFEIEKDYIVKADGMLNRYTQLFGNHFIITPLLEGIGRNITAYYGKKDEEFFKVRSLLITLLKKVKSYSDMFNSNNAIRIELSSYIEEYSKVQI